MVDNYNVETLEAVQHYIVKENNFFPVHRKWVT